MNTFLKILVPSIYLPICCFVGYWCGSHFNLMNNILFICWLSFTCKYDLIKILYKYIDKKYKNA